MFGIRTVLRNFYKQSRISCDYAVMRLEQGFRMPVKAEPEILFILGEDTLNFDDGRNVYAVLSLFSDAGYRVYLHPRKRLDHNAYRVMGYCARKVFRMKNVKLLDRLPKSPEAVCLATDSFDVDTEILNHPWRRWVFLNFLKAPELNLGTAIQVPYSMHARIHSHKTRFELDKWRQAPRAIRLFFAGNMSKDYYDSHAVKKQGALSRLEALRVLKSYRGPVEQIATREFLQGRMKSRKYFNGCVLVETGSFGIAPSRWLETISRSDFFLCLSGTDYPVCHNAIETMAVGTIPVIGYADWFDPPLEHGKNAVVFSDSKDLEKKVRLVLEMPEEKILEMRKNAADYYDRHLSAKSFVHRFETMPQGPGTLILFPLFRAEVPAQKELASSKELYARLVGHRHDS